MHPMVARACIAPLLSSEQREKLRKYERSLPPGRYLQGFEICRMLRLKPTTIAEEETDRIQNLYFEWEKRILWPINNAENIRHERECRDFVGKNELEIKPMKNNLKWCKCRTRQQEVHEWEDWALQNMDRTTEDLRWI